MKTLKKNSILFLFTFLTTSCSNSDDSSNSGTCKSICTYTLASGETTKTVPSSLHGSYTLTYHSAQNGSPFTNGTTATFTVSNNELTVEINDECITLKNAVLIGTNNYKFIDDCRNNIGYNLSPNNNGSFNEINIEPIGQGWYGQFSE